MCGIIYQRRYDGVPAHSFVERQYNRQKSRGSEGFGFVAVTPKGVRVRRAETESKIMQYLAKEKAAEILFHHRLPTSTPNLLDCAHPIMVRQPQCRYVYYVVHNGIIRNAEELKKEHAKQGIAYTTTVTETTTTRRHTYTQELFVDSEALAIDLALYLEGKQDCLRARGSIAVVALQVDKNTKKPTALYFGHNAGSPLLAERTAEYFTLASEYGNLNIPADTLYRYDYPTDKMQEMKKVIPTYAEYMEFVWNDSYSEFAEIEHYCGALAEQQKELLKCIKIAEQSDNHEELWDLWEQYHELELELREFDY
jgi:glucosamine 6-phosphate synthetase-like amidotransferase/phosphosugar isomerase protein